MDLHGTAHILGKAVTEMLARENLSEQLAKILGDRIIHNDLKSGEIIYETQLAKEWGVSRSPVRDALRTLERKRLVERTPGGSYRVAELSLDYVTSFYDAINLLYQYGFLKAAEKATREDLEMLSDLMGKIEKSVAEHDFDGYVSAASEYGRAILGIAGNPIVGKITEELMPTAQRIMYAAIIYLPERFEEIVHHVRASYGHILSGKPREAAGAFADFAALHKEIVLKSMGLECPDEPGEPSPR